VCFGAVLGAFCAAFYADFWRLVVVGNAGFALFYFAGLEGNSAQDLGTQFHGWDRKDRNKAGPSAESRD
jgi:hypothetical protein